MPQEQWARVPIELLQLVDANALQLYVALCKYAGKRGHCWPSNGELSDVTGQSDAGVRRSLKQLVDVGAVVRKGRQRRVIQVVQLDDLSLTGDRKAEESFAHPRAVYRSPVSDGTRCIELEDTSPLRDDVRDESESDMQAADDEPLFEIEHPEPEPRELPVGAACLAAYFDAYGTQPFDMRMRARLGAEFKRLAATYDRDELIATARLMGSQHVAAPNAVEGWLLRARQPAQRARSSWSALAADTYAQLPDPFTTARTV